MKNFFVFSQTLATKSMWRLFFNGGKRGKVMRSIFFKDSSLEDWIRLELKSIKGASIVWKGMVKSLSIVGKWVAWKVVRGDKIVVGD